MPAIRTSKRPDPLLAGLAGLTAALACVYLIWLLFGGRKSMLPASFYPVGSTVMMAVTLTMTLVSVCVGSFLALGRHRFIRDATSWWIGAGLSLFFSASVFRLLSFPVLPGGRAMVGNSPSSPAWIILVGTTALGACLLIGVLDRTPPAEKPRSVLSSTLWPVLSGILFIGFIRFGEQLPVMVASDGRYTPHLMIWQSANTVILALGAILSVRRYVRRADRLAGYVAYGQITLTFALLLSASGGNRYSVISAAGGCALPIGFLVMVFGLLSDYVTLLARERSQTIQLRGMSADLTAILDGIPDAVIVTDSAGAVRFASRIARQMLPIDPRGNIPRSPLGIPAPSLRAEFGPDEIEYVRPGDGERRWLRISGRPLSSEDGLPGGSVLLATDITARRQSEDHISHLNRQLDANILRLEASLREKLLLLREVRHRVKNNLQIIGSIASLQARQTRSVEARQAMLTLSDRVKSMALIHEGLCFSGMLAEIDFDKYVRDLGARLIQSYCEAPDSIHLSVDVPVTLTLDEAAPCGLIVNELLSNSLKHAFRGRPSGEIAIECHNSEGHLTLEFRDNGIGMPVGFRLEDATTLGLQMVSDLTLQLGGQLTWETRAGSIFRLRFPRTETNRALSRESLV